MREALAVKLADRSERDTAGCLIWTGGVNSNGYGRVCLNKKTLYAHRVAWELANGSSVPDGLFVCHHCDTPRCIEPSHLFLGTNQDNIADMHRKGRARGGRMIGENNPWSRLTWAAVSDIRSSSEPRKVLAERYGVTLRHIFAIRAGRQWLSLAPLEAV